MDHHEINRITAEKINIAKHEAKKRKFKPKTEIQRLKTVFYILTVIWIVAQICSAFLAATGFIHFANTNLNGNSFILTLTVASLCIGLELAFNKLNGTIHQQIWDDETKVNPVLYGMLFSIGLVYVASTFFGSPYAVQFVVAAPDYNNIEEITSKHDLVIKKDSTYWNGQIQAATLLANNFLKSQGKVDNSTNEWRIRSGASKEHRLKESIVDSLHIQKRTSFASLLLDKNAAIELAHIDNEKLKSAHFSWCQSAGLFLSFLSLFFVVVFILANGWCAWYQRQEIKDNDTILGLNTEVKTRDKANIQKVELEDKVTSKNSKNKDSSSTSGSRSMQLSMSSIKEGDIDKGKGRKKDRVYVMVNGELRAMTQGQINTLMGDRSTDERIKHLEQLKNKLS